MRTYITDLIPKLQRYSKILDATTLLTNQEWVLIDEASNSKVTYIFDTNNELIISNNGIGIKAKWKFRASSLVIEDGEKIYVYKHGFFDQNVLALKVDGKGEFALLVNENKYDGEIDSVEKVFDFLKNKYMTPDIEPPLMIENDHFQNLNVSREEDLLNFNDRKREDTITILMVAFTAIVIMGLLFMYFLRVK